MRRNLLHLLLVLCLALGAGWLPTISAAQDAETGAVAAPVDYEAWDSVATRAESAVEAARASTDALEDLRAEVAAWRERFVAAQTTNAARIQTLREQIAALGPVPEGDATEAEEIADRRRDLNAQLAQARAPVLTAEEAFRRAEGIIRQIDTLIRSRQAGELLSLGPSPVNPALWPAALDALTGSARDLMTEVQQNWRSEINRDRLKQRLPQIILYLLIAAALVARGRHTMERLTQTVLERFSGRARLLAAFATSLFQVVVPVLGLLLLVGALQLTGLPGLMGTQLVAVLPAFGIFIFGARWLGLRLYPVHPDAPRPLPGADERGREMRFHMTWIGALIGVAVLMNVLSDLENYADATHAVLFLPIYLLFGLTYVRAGRILSVTATGAAEPADAEMTLALRGQRLIGQALVIIGILTASASAIGYQNAAYYLAVPTAVTLGLLGLLRVLHDIVVELYAVAARKTTDEAREALLPSLISFAIVLCSMPLFALIWGARVADLTELWATFREGFVVGEAQISPGNFLTFVIVFSALYAGTRMFQAALKSSVLPKTKIDPGGQNAIVSGIGYMGIFLAAFIAISTAGIDLSALAFVFGALSVGIGFGLQNIVSNFISGIILLVERPVAEGDWIEVGGYMGIVRDISVRSTRIETFDRNDVIVPNADFISGAVKNWTRGNNVGRIIVAVGVAYGTDTRKVQDILMEIAMDHPLVALDPEPGVDFLDFGASSLDFQIRMVLRDINQGMAVRTEIRHQIAERFAAEGIEIPFAQQDIWLRNPETLRAAPPKPKPADGPVTEEDDAAPPDGADPESGGAGA